MAAGLAAGVGAAVLRDLIDRLSEHLQPTPPEPETALPEYPGISHALAGDRLTVRVHDDEGGVEEVYSGQADSERFFRAEDGTILGRLYGDGVILNESRIYGRGRGRGRSQLTDAAGGDPDDDDPNEGRERHGQAKRAEQRQVDAVARDRGIDRNAFGRYVEAEKRALGRASNHNFTFRDLMNLAQQYIRDGGR